MRKYCIILLFLGIQSMVSFGQVELGKFGKGLRITGPDSSFYTKISFRFQNLATSSWTASDGLSDYESNFLVRRSRLKMDGWAVSPKIKYKLELALSNRDTGGGASPEFRNTSNIVLDAWVRWNFYKNFSVQFGQGKLPGNRERVISSGDLQLVDRSRLNSRYTIDRDVGLQFKHDATFGRAKLYSTFAFSQGEGRNETSGHFGGFNYTFHTELLPFGDFQSKGHYVGSAIKRESTPKLAIAAAYNLNVNSVRERGQLGRFIRDAQGEYFGKNVAHVFADMMFKYQNWSVMAEYASRSAVDGDPQVRDNEGTVIGTYYTGDAFNIQAGYNAPSNWEVSMRYTDVNPDAIVDNPQEQYTLGISKFVVGHKLKFQTDFTFINRTDNVNQFEWRSQVDFHF